jgi:RNA-binding protein YlmH
MTEDNLLRNRFAELAQRAYMTGKYSYSNFLGLHEADVLLGIQTELSYAGIFLFGGAKDCERKIARFGSAEICGYDEPFPVSCIRAEPLQQKFADALTHRDVLGALMNLGIERDLIGDIYLKDNVIYFFCLERVSKMLISDFTKVKHTPLRSKIIDALPDGVGSETAEEAVQIASERADVLVAAAYRLSREESLELFRELKVYLDGRLCENNSGIVKPGTVISVRGHGRFRYLGYDTLSRKGKLNAKIAKWV